MCQADYAVCSDPETWADVLADEDGAGRVSDDAFEDFVGGEEIPDCF